MGSPRESPPFLESEPPHWAARGLAYVLLVAFAGALLLSVTIRVPESVSGRFTLVPVRGTDPIRAARRGTLVDVRVREGDAVPAGDTLFVIRSEPFGDRFAELRTLRAQIVSSALGSANLRARHESQQRVDAEETRRLAAHAAYLRRTTELTRRQLILARELARSHRAGLDRGVISRGEYTERQLEADELAVELERLESERADTEAAVEKLRHEAGMRSARYREELRQLESAAEEARIRVDGLERVLSPSTAGELTLVAGCAGTLLRLHVATPGAVVQEGDVLGELACAGERLQGELVVPQVGLARLRAGQAVKLLYDAFPYQRFGVRHGSIRWVGPGGVAAGEGGEAVAFRALVDLVDTTVRVGSEVRDLVPGMRGTGNVIVGRRTLVSYAFEPIRRLRESMAEPPARPTPLAEPVARRESPIP